MAPLERAMVVSYRLSIVTVAISVLNHSAAVCDRMSPTLKSTGGWVTLGPNLGGVPLGADPSCWGCKERTFQTNGEIIFEEFQPM